MIPLIMSVLYVWAQMNRDMIVSFWFGTRFKVQIQFCKNKKKIHDLFAVCVNSLKRSDTSMKCLQACYLPWVILGFNYIIGGS